MGEKRCTKCGETKPLDEFYLSKRMKDGHGCWCKKCLREWYKGDLEKHREQSQNWRKRHPEKYKECYQNWRKRHPEKYRESYLAAGKKRRSTPDGKLNDVVSREIRKSMKQGRKNGRNWEELVGYTIGKLMKHLEKQFKDGMSWDNHGKWHIDHKVPISAFNYKTPDDIDFKKCWALKNLQPMWSNENIKKSNKLDRPFQPSFAFTI